MKDKIQLSHLQDLYYKRLTDKGYDLERGIKGCDNKHIKRKEYKKLLKNLIKNYMLKMIDLIKQ